MPTYEYQCEKCGHRFDFFQSMKADRLTDCALAECDGRVKRLIGTGAGIIFKGSGFYETDYRSDSYKKAAEADKPDGGSSSDSGSSDSSSSDSGSGSAKESDSASGGGKNADSGSGGGSGSGGDSGSGSATSTATTSLSASGG